MLRILTTIIIIVALSGCTTQQATDAAAPPKQIATEPKENILACLGVPVAGQKCGLSL